MSARQQLRMLEQHAEHRTAPGPIAERKRRAGLRGVTITHRRQVRRELERQLQLSGTGVLARWTMQRFQRRPLNQHERERMIAKTMAWLETWGLNPGHLARAKAVVRLQLWSFFNGQPLAMTSEEISGKLADRYGRFRGAVDVEGRFDPSIEGCYWPKRRGWGEDAIDDTIHWLQFVCAADFTNAAPHRLHVGDHGPYYPTREIWLGEELLRALAAILDSLAAWRERAEAGARSATAPADPGAKDRRSVRTDQRTRDRGTPGGRDGPR